LGLLAAGNVYALVLVLGFSGLTAIEGGLHGHAVAWLAVVPLCATLLVDQTLGRWWCGVCLAVVAAFCALDFAGLTPAPFYPLGWDKAITAAGYLSLTLFMSALGLLFERGRRHSFFKLNRTLDALSTANARLKDLDRERAEFLGIAAHDLRSPLNTIVGFAQLVGRYDPQATDTQREHMETIIRASGHMLELLNRFLSVRAIEEGRLEMRPEPCDLHQAALQVVDGYRQKARDKNLRLAFDPAAGQSPFVTADGQSLRQIIDNLVSNAIKFSPRDRSVTVRVLAPGGAATATVEVQDAGPGLSEEDQRELYGKFARLSARPTGGESSSGLGLSIVKRLAEAMGGRLECRSRLGEGATFSLTLPVTPSPGENRASAAAGPRPAETPAKAVAARLRV
ncbi:MAG: HAMP domain-containing histidine kinase, partial [Gluconacetobacter diazotrophicus]|nr:HAMP domain-containing histidine kinase [Gluconacetobacter diazotrophicus]